MKLIRKAARAEHVSLVVGAGASVPSDLPTWENFARGLLKHGSRPTPSDDAIAAVIDSQGVRLASEAAMNDKTDKDRRDLIARALYGKRARRDYVPTGLHRAVADLAIARGPENLTLITLNYDELLERALELRGATVRARSSAGYSGTSGAHVVHHLHGLLGTSRYSNEFVVTESDYFWSRDPSSDWRSGVVSEAAAKGPMVFVGTSLVDPNLLHYRCVLRERRGAGQRIAVLPRQGTELGSANHDDARALLRSQWNALGVAPAFVEDYADVTTFVSELVTQRETGRKSPAQRVRALWRAVEEGFETSKQDWSDALAATYRADLRSVLGSEGNLVLWVADGRGSLVRVAGNDRVHRDVRSLRRIPYRFDAGWVATDVVSYSDDDVVIRDLGEADHAPEAVPSRRWRTVAGISLTAAVDGFPTMVGALTAATTKPDDGGLTLKVDKWRNAMVAAANEWSSRLSDLV
jgi:NAD-dependent SIR2 family protein deacetylase